MSEGLEVAPQSNVLEVNFPHPKNLLSADLVRQYSPQSDWFASAEHSRSGPHGPSHLMRVFVLQETLSRLMLESGKVKPEQIDQDALRWAAVLHDVGRVSNLRSLNNTEIAATTADRVLPPTISQETRDKVKALILAHDKPYDPALPYATELAILKDADALDRVRFHGIPKATPQIVKSRLGGLDERYLTTSESHRLVPFAESLYGLSREYRVKGESNPSEAIIRAGQKLGIVTRPEESQIDSVPPSLSGERLVAGRSLKDRLAGVASETLKTVYADKLIFNKPNPEIVNDPEYQAALPILEDIHRQATSWHGTGRYQYTPPTFDKERDVLDTLIFSDGLIPHPNENGAVNGPEDSISLAASPEYALLYAERHFPKGRNLGNYAVEEPDGKITGFINWSNDAKRYFSSWGYFVMGPVAMRAAQDHSERSRALRDFRHEAELAKLDPNYIAKYKYYTRKYRRGKIPKVDVVRGGGSDIEGNYPILIGIKDGSYDSVPVNKLYALHEKRSTSPIRIRDFTHIEVPETYIEATKEAMERNRDILERNGAASLPIIPMEWGEEYRKTLPVSHTLDGKPLS